MRGHAGVDSGSCRCCCPTGGRARNSSCQQIMIMNTGLPLSLVHALTMILATTLSLQCWPAGSSGRLSPRPETLRRLKSPMSSLKESPVDLPSRTPYTSH